MVKFMAGFFLALFLSPPGFSAAPFGSDFWAHWGDGRAEMSGYQLTFPRYNEKRNGTAVLIFVTEPFSRSALVKADPGRPKNDVFQVMKLNLVRDFPTGIYDYNLMTSAFVSLESVNEKPAGSPVKVSFSSQEWCGHVYHQVLFRAKKAQESLHSYFGGEADQSREFSLPENALSEDALFHWARGLAGPFLQPGESQKVPLLTSLASDRLNHSKTTWTSAELSAAHGVQKIDIPAGGFSVRVYRAAVKNGAQWTFYVEDAPPHRIIQWENTSGEKGVMLKSVRLPYWEMNASRFEESIKELGL